MFRLKRPLPLLRLGLPFVALKLISTCLALDKFFDRVYLLGPKVNRARVLVQEGNLTAVLWVVVEIFGLGLLGNFFS